MGADRATPLEGAADPKPRLVLFVVALGTLLTAISGSSTNLALPDIGRDFGVALDTSRWVVLSFLVTVTAALPLAGRVGDAIGYNRLFLAGYALHIVAAAGCAAAPGLGTLVATRVLQGLAAAMVMAAGPALLTTTFDAAYRGRALGMLGTATYVGLAIGPPIGGLILTAGGWRWVFLIAAPVAAFITVLGWCILPARAAAPPGSLRARPFASLALFRSRTFSASTIAALFNYVALFVPNILIPFVLIEGHGLTQRTAGLVLAAQPIAMALTAAPAGWLSDRFGSRGLSIFGMIAVALGAAGLSFTDAASSVASIAAWNAVIGVGTGVFVTPNSSALMGAAPRGQQGSAGGIMAVARNLGMMIGVASATTFFAAAGGTTGHLWDATDYRALQIALLAAAGVAILGAVAAALQKSREAADKPAQKLSAFSSK
jgi:MFS family permease